MFSSVTRDTATLTDIVLSTWDSFEASEAFRAATDAARRLFHHSTAFWELHPSGDRIDLTACDDIRNPRAQKRVRRWANGRAFAHPAQQQAAQTLREWLSEPTHFPAIFWEEDAPTGNVGIFVSVDGETSFLHTLNAAAERFDCTPALLSRAHALREQTERALRPIAIGQFYGRNSAPELRMILRPTNVDWLYTLPPHLTEEAKKLLNALPPQSDVNLALSITATHTALAFEARYSADRVPNAEWKDWLAQSFPERTPLHTAVLEQMFEHDRPIIDAAWPDELLLDAFLKDDSVVPQLVVQFSHVKVQRDAHGALQRKLYLRADVAWAQLGSSAR